MNTQDVSHEDVLALIRPAGPRIDPVWLTPVKSDEEQTAEACIQTLVGKEHIYAFGDRTPDRKHMNPGDWLCFYATGKGVLGHARIAAAPERKPDPRVRDSERYPWTCRLEKSVLYINKPVVIDADLRGRLDAFRDKQPGSSWAWFVQATHGLSEADFRALTRG